MELSCRKEAQIFRSYYEEWRWKLGEVHHHRNGRRYSWKRKTAKSLEWWHQGMDTSVYRRGTAADQGSCSLEKRCPSCRQRSRQRIRHQQQQQQQQQSRKYIDAFIPHTSTR